MPTGLEILGQQIFPLIFLTFLIIFLCAFSDDLQAKFLPNASDSLFPHMNAIFGKDNPNLFRAETLLAVIKDLLYLQHDLSLFLLIFALVCLTENVVVKCSPCNTQRIAQLMEAIWITRLIIELFKGGKFFLQWHTG